MTISAPRRPSQAATSDTSPSETSGSETSPSEKAAARPSREVLSVAALLVGTALLYLWNLGASGWANGFYAAAVQAGSADWKALLFGSSDAANAITVDKTPAALWVMGLSARVFGFNSWSMLVPQALMGVAAVAVLYAAVRRVCGPRAGLLAGVVLALTPAAALMFRFNNPDALLVLTMVVCAYCVLRALDRHSGAWWLIGAGTALGVGFLAKMLQAFLVAPVFALVFLICADLSLRSRLLRLGAGTAALTVSAGWYLLLVALWPAGTRPYIGGSQKNSVLELALGYNGLGRITGNETGGLGNMNRDVGWARLVGGQMGGEIGWLLPAAVIATIAGLWLTRRAPRTDIVRAALLLWGGWLIGTAAIFSYMNGIVHPYYTVALAPAVAAALAGGGTLLWQHRTDVRASTTLAAMVIITVLLSYVLLERNMRGQPWLSWTVVIVGLTVGLLLVVVGRLSPRAAAVLGAAAAVVLLAGPGAYSVATAAAPHTGAIPSAGPGGGFGGPPGFLDVSRPGATLTATLTTNASHYTWAAAAVGSNNAAGYQLAGGAPVLAVGGFNGTDPSPTLAEFQGYAGEGRIHYFIGSARTGWGRGPGTGGTSGGSDTAQQITAWVEANFTKQTIDGVTVYDLSA